MAVHLYGVVASGTPTPREPGRHGQPVRLVEKGDLAVLVSDVDEHVPARANDLLTHARVLEECVGYATVVPMQFGILLPDDAVVCREVLVRDGEWLAELLQRFDGLVQLTVRVFADEDRALREVVGADPTLLAGRVPTARSALPSQLELGQAVVAALQGYAEERAVQVSADLESRAVSVRVTPPQGVTEVLNAAYLVHREAMDDFGAAVARIRREHTDLTVRYVGPQPPYSFVEAPSDQGVV